MSIHFIWTEVRYKRLSGGACPRTQLKRASVAAFIHVETYRLESF